MGNSNWKPQEYKHYSKSVASKSAEQIFTNTSGCHDDLDPTKFDVRESCDSDANPESTPVIIGVDVTGSMGHLATEIVKRSLGVVVEGIYDRKPVTDPHVMLAAIGDTNCDRAPIQMTQFEADVKLVEQIEKIFIEHGGGGNGGESYPVLWWAALHKTACDAMSKNGRKGYLFTIGDESPHQTLTKEHIKEFLNVDVEADVSITDLLEELQNHWNVFHLITPTMMTKHQNAEEKWKKLLGERAIVISDHSKLGEVIVSTMQVNEGQDVKAVCNSWDGDTNIVVRDAVSHLTVRGPGNKTGVEEVSI